MPRHNKIVKLIIRVSFSGMTLFRAEPKKRDSERKHAHITFIIDIDIKGIFILFIPYAILAINASNDSTATSNMDSNILITPSFNTPAISMLFNAIQMGDRAP